MLSFNHVTNSTILPTKTIRTTSSAYRPLTNNKKQTSRKRPKTTTFTTITTTSFFSVHITNLTSSTSSSSSISSSEQQQVLLEDTYSAKTGIKIAAILGGMLLMCILYLIWKARSRLCRSLSSGIRNPRLSATKFDLEYWLKQVDLLEAKEAERNLGSQSPYLELPIVEPRNNREATALWIVDAYRNWRLIQYRQQQQLFRKNANPQSETNPIIYRRRLNPIRRLIRRFLMPHRQHSSFLLEHSQSLINEVRPSIVCNNFIPPSLIPNLPIRRTASWPRLKSSRHQIGVPMSALQTHLVRKRLLKRTSRTTIDI
ncbi:unnamed protein product [Rotaria socialis]|uniref:Uncharacterized protein n=1 Tax=Rotaria socialis TaxID=392032 RepID=A0A819YV73_9BILA|nr:unnamed protein product [Rotaria socialis]CAF3373645.1 unnamed protein product [Rotaria socialis]CAF3424258.1 unnamed protein product [Rotaria socialis]CAF3436009.1 unnamed protein product [Rotaria socialis]CAF4163874.1 unnamed protein product [Rotaria socialis]